MRLIKVESIGFKSFADKVSVTFENNMTGIVGPNGCGKSNITDAVKWVLGEQSAKALRAQTMDDIIFNGSSSRAPLNYAEVSLVFDNSDGRLPIDYKQVEFTRRVYRGEGSNEYFINKTQCRFKDIQDLILDTGLGKGSLAIISQGSVMSFAESTPEDRRVIFEEAAGVAKYKKRKDESLRKLERTQENLSRVQDLIFELEKQVGPLKRQSDKAKIYLEKSTQLKEIEVALLVKDIDAYLEENNTLGKKIKEVDMQSVQYEAEINTKEMRAQDLRNKSIMIDKEIDEIQRELEVINKEAHSLEVQKMAVDSKREALALTRNYIDTKERIKNLEAMISDTDSELRNWKRLELNSREDILNKSEENANLENRIVELHNFIETTSRENDRHKQKKEYLVEQLRSNSHLHKGVQQLLNNKHAISGMIGVVQDLIKSDEKYDLAITAALGNHSQSVVIKTGNDAKRAIKFLKDNRAGRATFLPLDTIEVTQPREDLIMAAQTIPGYIGFANDLVECQNLESRAIQFAFNNTIVAETLDAAMQISNIVYKRYRIATLNGEIVNAGGSIVGGEIRANDSTSKNESIVVELTNKIESNEIEIVNSSRELVRLKDEKRQNDNYISSKNMELARISERIDIQEGKKAGFIGELEDLTGDKFTQEISKASSELIDKLNIIVEKREALHFSAKQKRENKVQLTLELEASNKEINHTRKLFRELGSSIEGDKNTVAKNEVKLDIALTKLNSTYKMTIEFARENSQLMMEETEARKLSAQLNAEIEALGNINIDSIEEYANVNTRYEEIKKQMDELVEARKIIFDSIDEMDTHMKEKFSAVFEDVKVALKETFVRLFGGGMATLEYTDPENILESGIEVRAQPPGKTVSRLSLFSGGEKSLIATSVLLAILKARPLPLCILDELDAPLDAVNVERYAGYIKEFTDNTQFIIVTHRSGTMGLCEHIYGVTMQEPGITKMLSVRLEDAMRHAEDDKEDK